MLVYLTVFFNKVLKFVSDFVALRLLVRKIFPELAYSCTMFYGSADTTRFNEDLLNIARTTLSSKILSQHKEYFSKLAVDAVLRLKGSGNLSAIQIIKKTGGTLEDSFLEEGIKETKQHVFHISKFMIGDVILTYGCNLAIKWGHAVA